MVHVLLVDDDRELRQLVGDYLQRYGMRVTALPDATGLRRELRAGLAGPQPFQVLLLDLMLPDGHGLDLFRWARSIAPLPVIMLTAQGDPASRVVGLELGADDYLPKPFEPRELVARIHAVLRRSSGSPAAAPSEAVLRFGGWTFDRMRRQLSSPEQVMVALSSAEFRLLSAFVEHPNRVLSREQLLDLTRAPGVEVTDRSVDLTVSRLRQKLDAPNLIRTVRGEGYLFDAAGQG